VGRHFWQAGAAGAGAAGHPVVLPAAAGGCIASSWGKLFKCAALQWLLLLSSLLATHGHQLTKGSLALHVGSQDAPATLLAASFHLSYYCEEEGSYQSLPLQAVMLDNVSASSAGAAGGSGGGNSSSSSKMLLLIAEESVAAVAWEVGWELPAGAAAATAEASATAVLQRLRVNPRACGEAAAAASGLQRQLRLPPPLAASLTVVLSSEGASLALLAPAPLQQQPAAALLDAAAVMHLGSFKAALHTYPAAEGSTLLAADLQATIALCLPDSSSSTAPAGAGGAAAPGWALIEPFQLDAAVEYSSCPAPLRCYQQSPQEAGEAAEPGGRDAQQQERDQLQTFWPAQQQQQELPLLAVRTPPLRPGLALLLAAQLQPVVVNASEGGLAEVKRLLAVVSGPEPDSSNAGEGSAVALGPMPPLLLVNRSGLALWLRQEGTQQQQQQLLLQQGQRLPLVWPAPPALVPGVARRLQLAAAAGAADEEACWSGPIDVRHLLLCFLCLCCARNSHLLSTCQPAVFDMGCSPGCLAAATTPLQVMATGGHPLLLPMPGGGCSSSLAVQVQRSSCGGSWEVLLLPGMRVVNHLAAAMHVALTDSSAVRGSPAKQGRGQQQQQQHEAVEVGSGCSTNLQVQGISTQLRLWLGDGARSGGASGSGWSQALLLPRQERQEALLMVLHSSPAAGASATAAGLQAPAAAGAACQQLGAVLAQMLPPDAASGQASIHFWPPLLLHNAMPCAVRLLLPAPGTAAGQQQQQHVVVLQPGASHQLTVPLQGGRVGALLALDAAASSGGGNKAEVSAAGDAGVALVVPPLIAESAEQQWFGSSGLKRAAAPAAGPALFIAPPGESACLRLPLVLDSAAAPAAAAADCVMVTQQHTDGLPLLQLSLVPALVVHNCLPVPLLFQVRQQITLLLLARFPVCCCC
jgi:hypothetical protein